MCPNPSNKIDGIIGRKNYECANHLGNVITTISNRKLQVQGTSIELLNDYETSASFQSNQLAFQSNQLAFAGSYSCKLTNQNFSPDIETQVQRGDNVTASVKTNFTDPTTTGALVTVFTDDYGNGLYAPPTGVQWLPENIIPASAGSWQTLTNIKTVPTQLYSQYTSATNNIPYNGNVYAHSYFWNTVAGTSASQIIYLDDHKLKITPVSPLVAYYKPDVQTTADYYAFGQTMPGRTYASGGQKYKRGFIGKESDKDDGLDSYDFGNRIYNEKLGKFLSVDPLESKYPFFSPYHYAGNSPIYLKDNDGNDIIIHYKDENGDDQSFNYKVGIIKETTLLKSVIAILDKLNSVSQRMSDPDLEGYKGVNVSPHEMINSLMEKGYKLHLYIYDADDTNNNEDNIYKHIGSDDFGTPSLMAESTTEKKSNIYYSPFISAEEYNGDKATKTGGAPTAVSILAHELKHSYDHQIGMIQKLKNKEVPNYKNLAEKSAMMMENIVTVKKRCDYHTPNKRKYSQRFFFTHKYKVQSDGTHKYNGGKKKHGNFKNNVSKAFKAVKSFLKRIGQRIGKAFKKGRYNLNTKNKS